MTGTQLKTQLSDLVDSLIADRHPEALDDDLSDILQNEREQGIDDLVKFIESNREFI